MVPSIGIPWIDFIFRALLERAQAQPRLLSPFQKQRQLEREPWRSFSEHPRAQLLADEIMNRKQRYDARYPNLGMDPGIRRYPMTPYDAEREVFRALGADQSIRVPDAWIDPGIHYDPYAFPRRRPEA
jgi:hypothetical protein